MPKNVTWVKLPLVEWVIVRSYNQFVQVIKQKGLPSLISFDHDLSYEDEKKTKDFKEKNGYDCAKFLFEYCMSKNLELPKYYIHSLNVVGRENIFNLLNSFNKFQNID
jgi:hypothetical protein